MIEFRGIKVQTQTLVIAGGIIALIIVLWPEDERKTEAGITTASNGKPSTVKQLSQQPAKSTYQERPQWRQPPLGQTPYSPAYPSAQQPNFSNQTAPPLPAYNQPGSTTYNPTPFQWRPPEETATTPKPMPGNPYAGQTNPAMSAGPKFRPLKEEKKSEKRYSGGYQTPAPATPQAYYPSQPTYQTPAPVYGSQPSFQPTSPQPEYPGQHERVESPPMHYADPYGTPWEYPTYQDYNQPGYSGAPGAYPNYR